MDERLSQLLKDNVILVETGQFLQLFALCPRFLRDKLIEIFKKADIPIVDNSDNSHYYVFRNGNMIYAANKKVDNKVTEYQYMTQSQNSDKQYLFIACTDFNDAIEFAIGTSTDIVPLAKTFVDKHVWVPITMTDGRSFVLTQKGVDYYDATKQKELKFRNAAKAEYDARLNDLYASVYNKTKLSSLLRPYDKSYDQRFYIFNYPTGVIIRMEWDDSDLPEIKNIISRNFNIPVDINLDAEGSIEVVAKGPRVDRIKSEVEETFGVSL